MSELGTPQPEINPELSRNFRLDEVLTVVSGVNFLDIQNDSDDNAFTRRIGGLLSYATNEGPLEVFQLPRVADEVVPSILADHPELVDLLKSRPKGSADASPEEKAAHDAAIAAWYKLVMEQYGDKMGDPVAISPIDPKDHTHIDAGAEFQLMGGITVGSDIGRRISKPDILPGARIVPDPELQDLFNRAIPDWGQVGTETSHASGDTVVSEGVNVNPVEAQPSAKERAAGDIGQAALKGDAPSALGFDQEAYERYIADHTSEWGREQMGLRQQADDGHPTE